MIIERLDNRSYFTTLISLCALLHYAVCVWFFLSIFVLKVVLVSLCVTILSYIMYIPEYHNICYFTCEM